MNARGTLPINGRKEQIVPGKPVYQQLDDNHLLLLVGRDRDEAAFSELFQRYQEHAFNLAHFITRDPELAQEAVQEALLGIWFTAQTYTSGNAKGWFLKAVSQKSLNFARNKRRRNQHMKRQKREGAREEQLESDSGAQALEHREALRTVLRLLDLKDRQLVALRYGAGMSQRQIAEELAVPQRTISDRIRKLLAKLRNDLQRNGVFTSAEALTATCISDALCTGLPVPPQWAARIIEKLSTVAPDAPSIKTQTPKISETSLWVWVVPILILAGATTWLAKERFSPDKPNASLTPPGQAAPKISLPPNVISPKETGFFYENDFDEPALDFFWKKAPLTGLIKTGVGVNGSQLILHAECKPKQAGRASAPPWQITELVSKQVLMGAKGTCFDLEFDLRSGMPTGSGRIEYGFAVLRNNQKKLLYQVFSARSLPDGTFQFRRSVILDGRPLKIKNPNLVVPYLWENSFDGKIEALTQAEAKSGPAHLPVQFRYPEKGLANFTVDKTVIAAVSFRFFVKAYPNSWIHWPLNGFSVTLKPTPADTPTPPQP